MPYTFTKDAFYIGGILQLELLGRIIKHPMDGFDYVGLVEEANYKSTTELFGKKGNEKSVDNFIPKSKSDFVEYAKLVSPKLRPFEISFHYIGLLKAVMRLLMTSLKATDAK